MLDKDFEDLLRRYNVNVYDDDFIRSKEIFPSQIASVVLVNDSNIALKQLRWGYKSHYGKKLIINARSETAMEKRLFKNSFIHRRCIVPTDGFFEWESIDGKKVKRSIKLSDNGIFSLAGMYRTFLDDEGNEFDAFTILTTSPSEQLSRVHNRMPVIINKADEGAWLDPKTNLGIIKNLCNTNDRAFEIA